ncbi:alpha/beta fold hydrolase [Saccharospirillum sp.]|uniref:alpha/beta fold hydrolase n=1 Tax=Saccharospirillum sp. TaxID=2033801 RepID=UPI0034A04F4D
MPNALLNGIRTEYRVEGSGPPLLMFAPGGFDASMDKWENLGVYARIKLLDYLPAHFTCILFDRRETGQSGGRVERLTWSHYVEQGHALLEHLDIDQAHLIGGCMGCCPVAAFATTYPERTLSMVQYWPVGGAGFRLNAYRRFALHTALVETEGLQAVVDCARATTEGFGKEPKQGPWGPAIRQDEDFAKAFLTQDPAHYKLIVASTLRTLIDRDSVPGFEPEDLMQLSIPTLIIPGKDNAHAVSAARFIEECSARADYWDITPDDQTSDNAPQRIIDFLKSVK